MNTPTRAAVHPLWPRQLLALLGFLAVTFLVAAVGGMVTTGALDTWYPTLAKPSFNPPNWIFGPVWSTLYLAMAVAAWLVWRLDEPRRTRIPLLWYAVQLSLNLGWSLAFFGLHSPGLAFSVIVSLWLAIALTMRAFWMVSRPAGLLLAPYLAWVSFAAVLNLAIWRLNV